MAMSKKDFIALADALRPVLGAVVTSVNGDQESFVSEERLIMALCRFMGKQNPQFKEERWRDYLAGKCGPGGKVL